MRGDILDVGCGYLKFFNYYQRGIKEGKITTVHCIDSNPSIKMIGNGISKDLKENFIFEVNTLEKINLDEKKYDYIIMRYVFNHLNEKNKCVKKLHGCLKRGGKIYFLEGNIKDKLSKSQIRLHLSEVKNYIKKDIDSYNKILSRNDFNKLKEDMIKYYLEESKSKKYNLEEISNLFEKSNFKIFYKSVRMAFGENILQLILEGGGIPEEKIRF